MSGDWGELTPLTSECYTISECQSSKTCYEGSVGLIETADVTRSVGEEQRGGGKKREQNKRKKKRRRHG